MRSPKRPAHVLACVFAFLPLPAPGQVTTHAQCQGVEGYAAAFDGRRTFFLKPDQLVATKAALAKGDPAVKAAYDQLIRRADAALRHKPGSVMDKTTVPPSGDRHDYLSIAPYWWPDPAKTDGLPYLRHDGEVNPARDTAAFDRTAIGRLGSDAQALGLAYYYTGDARYADKLAEIVRVWFLDPATAMNADADFAQAVPGREKGRAEGVLDTSAFQAVIDAVGLLGRSDVLKPAEHKALEAWFGRYVDWMLTSANGRAENGAKNNHGIWFDSQIGQYALFARRPDVAEKVVAAFPTRRIAAQFDPSGSLPEELTRTRSLHYSIFALTPAYDVAEIAACLGHDLWNYRDAQGRGLHKATDFLAAWRGRIDQWPHQEIRPEPSELDELLTRANWAWGGYPVKPSGYPLALEYAGK